MWTELKLQFQEIQPLIFPNVTFDKKIARNSIIGNWVALAVSTSGGTPHQSTNL